MASAQLIKDLQREISAFQADLQAQCDALKAGVDAQSARDDAHYSLYIVLTWHVCGGGVLFLCLLG